ncbi:hypothetical protein EVA_07453 [gut metagenome]|uniref:Uncharacterized protein n=1 Tax=gut metagenome TaxID=749906 RepID=J9GC59_9ZZZZ
MLYSSSLRRTATVVGKRRNVDDFSYCDTSTVNGTDSRFTTVTGTLNICLHLTKTKIESYLSAILSSHLSCVRSVLLRTAEAHLTGGRPRNNLTLTVCERHNDIVERAMNVELTHSVNLYVSLLSCNCFLCHIYLLFSSFLLVSNSLLATLARASIVLRALTTNRETMTVTYTTIATDIHQTLDVQLNLRTKVTFNLEFSTNDLTDLSCLVVSPILHFDISVNASLIQDFSRATTTYTINVGQGDLTTFVLREVNTNNSYCHILVLFIADLV